MNFDVTQFNHEFKLVNKSFSRPLTKQELDVLSSTIENSSVKLLIDDEIIIRPTEIYECIVLGVKYCLVKECSIHIDFKSYRKAFNKFIKDNPICEYQAARLYNANMKMYSEFYNCSIDSLFKDYSRTRGFIKKLHSNN